MGDASGEIPAGWFRCDHCGGVFEEGDEADAIAEAEANGFDVAHCDAVCDECYARTPWGRWQAEAGGPGHAGDPVASTISDKRIGEMWRRADRGEIDASELKAVMDEHGVSWGRALGVSRMTPSPILDSEVFRDPVGRACVAFVVIWTIGAMVILWMRVFRS